MDVKGSVTKIIKDKYTVALVLVASIFIIIGIIFIYGKHEYSYISEKEIDYTDCRNTDYDKCSTQEVKPNKECICYLQTEISKLMEGQVTLYYELKTFDQSNSSYSQSRDDNQLRGVLSPTPSPNCGTYSYDGNKTIAPCGAIADSIFNDTFILSNDSSYVPIIFTGLNGITAEDKLKYHNPSGDLEKAFEGYAKPKNWRKNVWEANVWKYYDTDPNNSGLQNEAFIAWMKTDLKRKPVWRVNHTDKYEKGLPSGNYTMRITYYYPYSLYSGQRLVILSSSHTEITNGWNWWAIALILIGILAIIIKIIYNKKIYGGYVKPTDGQD